MQKLKHNYYRSGIEIVNHKLEFSKKHGFVLEGFGLSLSSMCFEKGKVHRFHQTHPSNYRMALVFDINDESLTSLTSLTSIKFLHVYRNFIVRPERYRELMENAIPRSCFVDIYVPNLDDSEITVESSITIPVNKSIFSKAEPAIQTQIRIKIVKDKMKLIECENAKYKIMKEAEEKEEIAKNSKLSPMEHYRITQIKAEEMRLANPATQFIKPIKDDFDSLYSIPNQTNDYDYLLMCQE